MGQKRHVVNCVLFGLFGSFLFLGIQKGLFALFLFALF